eukprot:2185300-Amphidinium_carterae.2
MSCLPVRADLERTENEAMSLFLTRDKEALDATAVPSEACRKWNRVLLRRLDGVLHTCLGFGLASFIPKSRCQELREGARRYLAEVVHPESGVKVSRSCIEEQDGSRRMELPRVCVNGQEKLPALHMTLDQGSIGWPLGLYIVYGLHVRGTVNFDIWHRVHNDWGLALKHMGLTTVKAAGQVALKMRGAPWASCHFHGLLRDYAAQHFTVHRARTPLFDLLYDDMSRSFGYTGKIEAERESDHALQSCWSACGSALEGASVGARVKLSRWFQHEQRSREVLKDRWPLVYILLSLGIERKWWSCVEQSPLMVCCADAGDASETAQGGNDGGDQEGLPEEGDVDASEVSAGRKRKGGEKDESKKKESNSASILKSVTGMLCDDIAMRLWSGFCELVVPIETWFHRGMQCAHEPRELCQWHVGLVEGSLFVAQLAMFDHFLTAAFAKAVDYKGLFDENLSAVELAADRDITETLWQLLLRTMWETGCTQLCYRTPPWTFLGLLSLDVSSGERHQAALRNEFEILQRLDKEVRGDAMLREWYKHCLVPQSAICREWFVRAYECRFGGMDPEFRDALHRFGCSHNATLLIENLFNTIRKDERVAAGGRLETERVWEVAAMSKEHTEFGRPHLRPREEETLQEAHGLRGYLSLQRSGTRVWVERGSAQ